MEKISSFLSEKNGSSFESKTRTFINYYQKSGIVELKKYVNISIISMNSLNHMSDLRFRIFDRNKMQCLARLSE